MSYLQKSSSRERVLPGIVFKTLLVAVLVGLISFPLKGAVLWSYGKFAPVRSATNATEGFFYSLFVSRYALEQNIHDLQTENQSLTLELALYQNQKELVDAQALFASSSASHIVARVISRPPFATYDTLVIDKGTADHVAVGNRVYAPENLLPIGTVTSVFGHASYVTLFSYPGNKEEAAIGTSTASFAAIGDGNGAFEVQVPRVVAVTAGETVRLTKESPLPYSSVEYVSAGNADPFTTVFFRLPIRFDQLEFVGIGN